MPSPRCLWQCWDSNKHQGWNLPAVVSGKLFPVSGQDGCGGKLQEMENVGKDVVAPSKFQLRIQARESPDDVKRVSTDSEKRLLGGSFSVSTMQSYINQILAVPHLFTPLSISLSLNFSLSFLVSLPLFSRSPLPGPVALPLPLPSRLSWPRGDSGAAVTRRDTPPAPTACRATDCPVARHRNPP